MQTPTQAQLDAMSEEKLRRKANQHWDMAGLARQDRDMPDAARQTTLARLYEDALARRRS